MTQHVFVYGDPVDGLGFVGPVETDDTELEAAFDGHTWWYAEMDSRANATWTPDKPDPDVEQEKLDGQWEKFFEAIWAADDLYHPDEVNIGLNTATDLTPLLALRDIISAWRALPTEDD
jgi:hypothetical protein